MPPDGVFVEGSIDTRLRKVCRAICRPKIGLIASSAVHVVCVPYYPGTGWGDGDDDDGTIVTIAVASALGSAALLAFTITVRVVVTDGAVKRPELEIFPRVAVHSTAVLLVPRKLEVNCSVSPEATVVLDGETTRLTPGGNRHVRFPTVNESRLSSFFPLLSVTDTTNEYLLAVMGRPEINPVFAFKAKARRQSAIRMENL